MAAGDPNDDLDPQKRLRYSLWLVKHRWFTIFTWTVLGLLVGIAVFNFMPTKYTSEARLLVRPSWVFENEDRQQSRRGIPVPLRAKVLEKELTSRSWIEAVLNRLEWPEWAQAKKDDGTKMDFIDGIKSDTTVYILAGEVGEGLVSIQFSHADRWKARDYVEELREQWASEVIDQFVENLEEEVNLRRAEVAEKKTHLNGLEGDIEEFQEQYGISPVRQFDDLIDNVRTLRQDLATVNQEIAELLGRVSGLEVTLNATDENGNSRIPAKIPRSQSLPNTEKERQLTEIGLLVREIEDLKARDYTDRHFRMQSARKRLTEALITYQGTGDLVLETEVFLEDNPRYRELQEEIEDLQVQLGGKRKRLEQIEGDYATADQELTRVPNLLSELERRRAAITQLRMLVDAAVLKLDPLEEKLKALNLENRPDYLPYKILENPSLPRDADATTGLVALVVCVMVGLGAAIATIFGRELLRDTFATSDEAERLLKLPILGEVGPIQTEMEAHRARLQRQLQIAASVTLLVGLAATIYLCTAHPELLPDWLTERAATFRAGLS